MEHAIENKEAIARFKNAFKNWLNTSAAGGIPTEEKLPFDKNVLPDRREVESLEVESKWHQWVAEWKGLHIKNYEKFVLENLDHFQAAPDWVIEKAKKKFEDIVKKPWPGESAQASDENQTSLQHDPDNAKSLNSGEGGNKPDGKIVQPGASQAVDFTQKVAGNLKVQSLDDVNLAIDRMNRELEKTSGVEDDIPW